MGKLIDSNIKSKWRDKACVSTVIRPSWRERVSILLGNPIHVRYEVKTKVILGEIQSTVEVKIPKVSEDPMTQPTEFQPGSPLKLVEASDDAA